MLKMQDIFNEYWYDFLDYADNHNLIIRPVVKRDVERMMICKTPHIVFSIYTCSHYDNTLKVYKTCKSRFCNSCGVKYAKQRSLAIESKLLDCNHRHIIFTIPDKLYPLFLEDRKRLNLMFEAVNITISSWFKEQYKKECNKPGFILTLHTFGKDDKFVALKIHIFEWIARLIRHIPDRNFKTIRYYGIYASREHKSYNTCRLLINKLKLPFYKSLTKWRNLLITTFNINPLKCPNCGYIMKFEYG